MQAVPINSDNRSQMARVLSMRQHRLEVLGPLKDLVSSQLMGVGLRIVRGLMPMPGLIWRYARLQHCAAQPMNPALSLPVVAC